MSIRVLSICYDAALLHAHHVALKQTGCEVDSVLGNSGAMKLQPFGYDIVVLCHAAPLQVRDDMLQWIRRNAPEARVIALRSSMATANELPGADAYAEGFSPEECMTAVLECITPTYGSSVA